MSCPGTPSPWQLSRYAGYHMARLHPASPMRERAGVSGFGAVAPPMPPYVGAAISPHGQVYYRVLKDQAAAAAMALNHYQLNQTLAATPGKAAGTRTAGDAGDFGQAVFAARAGLGVGIIGDPMADAQVTAVIGDSIPALHTLAAPADFWVLVEPDQGWQRGDDRFLELVNKHAAIVGLSWGMIAGGVAGVVVVALVARRRR